MPFLNKCKVVFCNVTTQDSFSQKYQIVVQMSEDQAADAEEAGIQVKTKEYDNKTQYQATFKSKFAPAIVDGATKPYNLDGQEIPRGSLVNIKCSFRDWVSPCGTKKGTGQDLSAVQVCEMAEAGSSGFEDVSGFSDEAGDSGDSGNSDY
tara:strand:- start:1200 stop:1649 length:450 start_codon:yes stop_codon:yes gene_type:complete